MILNFLKGFNVDGQRKSTDFERKIEEGIKVHTIRWDATNRWKKGNKIHFSTGARSSKYNCFKEGVCTGVQSVIMERDFLTDYFAVIVDGRLLDHSEIIDLSLNDGFETLEDFEAWFDQYTPFTGKIIHWTGLRY